MTKLEQDTTVEKLDCPDCGTRVAVYSTPDPHAPKTLVELKLKNGGFVRHEHQPFEVVHDAETHKRRQ